MIETAQFQGNDLRYMKNPDNSILFNTMDLLRIIGVSERPAGSYLSMPCLDLVAAIGTAYDHNEDLAEWFTSTFSSYEATTSVIPDTDDDWSNLQ